MAPQYEWIDQLDGASAAVYIRCALFAPVDEAVEIIRRKIIAEPSWYEAPGLPFLLNRVATEAPDGWAPLVSELLRAVPTEGIERSGELLLALVHPESAAARECAVSWFVKHGGPGQAGLAIHSLLRLDRVDGHLIVPEWTDPVAEWLLREGNAELLRTADHGVANAYVALINIALQRHPEWLPLLLETLCRSERTSQVLQGDGGFLPTLWIACERACTLNMPIEIVREVFRQTRDDPGFGATYRYFEPLRDGALPSVRRAILSELAGGRWDGHGAYEAWDYALRNAPLAGLRLAPEALEIALAVAWREKSDLAWVEIIVASWFDVFGLVSPLQLRLRHYLKIDECALDPGWADIIKKELLARLAASDHRKEIEHARRCLERTNEDHRWVSAALLCLPSTTPERPRPRMAVETIEAILQRILDHDLRPLFEQYRCDPLFRGATNVKIGDTRDPNFLVEWDGDTLITGTPRIYGDLTAEAESPEHAEILCALFFVHEVMHITQGIGRKSDVTHLRRNAGEDLVLTFDLEADDFATRIVALVLNKELLAVKRANLRGLALFPVSRYHTNASAHRKMMREAGLLADLELRLAGSRLGIATDKRGFAQVLFPPQTGAVQFVWRGSFEQLVASVQDQAPYRRFQAALQRRASAELGALGGEEPSEVMRQWVEEAAAPQ